MGDSRRCYLQNFYTESLVDSLISLFYNYFTIWMIKFDKKKQNDKRIVVNEMTVGTTIWEGRDVSEIPWET